MSEQNAAFSELVSRLSTAKAEEKRAGQARQEADDAFVAAQEQSANLAETLNKMLGPMTRFRLARLSGRSALVEWSEATRQARIIFFDASGEQER